jgi:hypothetical protein
VAEAMAVVTHREDEASLVVDPVPAGRGDRRTVVPHGSDDGVARLGDEALELWGKRRGRHPPDSRTASCD